MFFFSSRITFDRGLFHGPSGSQAFNVGPDLTDFFHLRFTDSLDLVAYPGYRLNQTLDFQVVQGFSNRVEVPIPGRSGSRSDARWGRSFRSKICSRTWPYTFFRIVPLSRITSFFKRDPFQEQPLTKVVSLAHCSSTSFWMPVIASSVK